MLLLKSSSFTRKIINSNVFIREMLLRKGNIHLSITRSKINGNNRLKFSTSATHFHQKNCKTQKNIIGEKHDVQNNSHKKNINPSSPVRFVMTGCPGSGKGTQSKKIKEFFKIDPISSGDILRQQIHKGTPLGKQVQKFVSKGLLVPDELITFLVFDKLKEEPENQSWLLDGFPRTKSQAEILDKGLETIGQKIDFCINLDVPEQIILQRIMDRWIHAPSGRIYNLSYNPPKNPGVDDITGEPLTKRADDNVETFKVRLDTYHEQTLPLLDYYNKKNKLYSFKGETSKTIWPFINELLKSRLN